MAGTFTIPEFNSSYTITDSNLVRIGDKIFFETMYYYFENHLLSINRCKYMKCDITFIYLQFNIINNTLGELTVNL
jgi:hypothetical protein